MSDNRPCHRERLLERIEKAHKVLRIKKKRNLQTVSIERFEDAVALIDELAALAKVTR